MARDGAPRAWQRMLSGRRLDLLDPSPLDVEIEDIAHGLARVARWNGQTRGPHVFSVAQHSLLVEAIARATQPDLPARALLVILLHDAPEYVVGDMISPFKAVLGDGYKGFENRLLAAIHLRFGLPAAPARPLQVLTKAADKAAAFVEATRLAGFATQEALRIFGMPAALPGQIDALLEPWTADQAKQRFLDRFRTIEEQMAVSDSSQTA
jgi:5'-deoxynucleotidase YfbR-like HD superfamily hydrolase